MRFGEESAWHKWFAWRPVKMSSDGGCIVWLEYVERKHYSGFFWYRLPGEMWNIGKKR